MTNDLTDNLFSLIKSLSPSEKRQFSLFVGRIGVNADSKFLSLFKMISKQKVYDEEAILKSTKISKQQLSNVKGHLYRQILISLRLNPSQQNVSLWVREQLDFALILYRKGLYKQSLKILDKAKNVALQYEEKNIAFEILEWEKIIESQYITRSIRSRAESLVSQTRELIKFNTVAAELSNLSLELYGIFLKLGHARTQEEARFIRDRYYLTLHSFQVEDLGFREKLLLYKAQLWYAFLTQEFLNCYRYANKWNDLFTQYPHMVEVHPVSYLKGNHYLLESLFYLNHTDLFEKTLNRLEQTLENPKLPNDDNISALAFLYVYSNKLNLRFMKGDFADGQPLIDTIEEKIEVYRSRLDGHHIMMFYYKIASLHFGNEDFNSCIAYLKRILDNKGLEMREDLMCFSRILNLVAHYEAGKDYHLDRLIRSTYKFLIRMNDLHGVQREMIKFLKQLPDISPLDIRKEFKRLHGILKQYEEHPYERRAFLYLDILSWLESRIESRPVAEIIAQKAGVRKVRRTGS